MYRAPLRLFVLPFLLLASPALAQNGPGGNGPFGGNGGGGRGQFQNGQFQLDPAMVQQMISRYQQRQLDNIKSQLAATDDEFTALQPFIEKVIQLQTSDQISRISGFRLPGQNGQQGQSIGAIIASANAQTSELQNAVAALQTALDDTTTSAQIISVKLADLRAARDKVRDQLKLAQDSLRELLTQRQEATMVILGYLN